MPDPIKGEQTPPQGTPSPAPAAGQAAAPASAQGAAPAKPAEPTGQKFVPISAMHEERDKRQAAEAKYNELQAEIEQMKQQYQQYAPQPQPYQQQQSPMYQQPPNPYGVNPVYQQAPQNIREQIDALYDQDVRKGFQAEMMAMMQYRDWVDNKTDTEFDTSRTKHDDFGKYESKIRSYVRALPIDSRAQPNIVEAAYLMVRGQDTDNIIKAREAEWNKRNTGAGGATGLTGTFGQPAPAEGTQLTQDELIAAQAQGLTPEEYLKWR